MQLAGRLRRTTLGDLLGTLYRARAHGVLELTEDCGPAHRIHLAEGRVLALDSPSRIPPLGVLLREQGLLDAAGQRRLAARLAASPGRLAGEILLQENLVSRHALDAVLRKQLKDRLEPLFALPDAKVSFHVAYPRRRAAGFVPLAIADYLYGRPRARDRLGSAQQHRSRPASPPPPASKAPTAETDSPRARALRLLGLSLEANGEQIRRAFRAIAKDAHPDRYPHTSAMEQRRLAARFAAITEAYHLLLR